MNSHPHELQIPPLAVSDIDSQEFLRLWKTADNQQIILKHDIFSDPAAWGLCLADIARHVSRAFSQSGHEEKEAFDRIVLGFQIELEHPTDEPKGSI